MVWVDTKMLLSGGGGGFTRKGILLISTLNPQCDLKFTASSIYVIIQRVMTD